jgi:predicted amidohydrolase YtcJ
VGDLLIRDVRLVPVHEEESAPDDPVEVLVRDGLVAEVAATVARPPGVEEIQAAGRWLVPGLWDQHVHLGQWTLASQRVDTSGVGSPEEAAALVAERVGAEPGRPVIAWGHRPGSWTRQGTVTELDEVSGVTPVVLIAGDGHHGWLNSAALAALGLGTRDDVIRENEWFAAYQLLSHLVGDGGTAPAAYRRTLEAAAAQGVVGLVDYEFTGGVDEWVERWTEGCDLLRVRVATYADRLEDVIEARLRTGAPLLEADDRLTMGPLKIISDGSLNTRTAWCCEPYADGALLTQPAGAPNLSEAELTALLARAHMSGLEVATHAIGDAAVAAALDAYAATGARGSVEHAQLIDRADVRRLAGLDLRASVQPGHLLDDRDLTEQIWPGRGSRTFTFRWMLDDGVRLCFGSDAPVAPLDPWLAMAAAVHRSADDRPAWHPEQALTAREALAASVDGQPMVGVGSPADLALLDRDPLAEHADRPQAAKALREMRVGLTVVAGRVAHSAL